MELIEKLAHIQLELKAPKGQYNSFGKYNYRSCEDILEALKPICAKYHCLVVLSDELCQLGNRYYVKATVSLWDMESASKIENTALAREDEDKKGMDGSQITGTSSSYARKYALNGLFAIDDTKDADTNENRRQRDNAPADAPEPPRCKVCGSPIKAVKMSNGEIHSPEEVAKSLDGMCADCYRKAAKHGK